MNNRVAEYLDGLEGAAPSDLIEMIRERDQALHEITETNWQLTFERDMARREAEDYKAICVKYKVDEMRRKQAGGEIK